MPINIGAKACYGGPGKIDYAQVGTLNNLDLYDVLYNERGFTHIEYTVTSTGQKKRGFIEGESSGTYQAGYPSGVLGTMKSAQTALSGPGTQYASVGSVGAAESVSIFQETGNGYCYIEYSSPSKTKRGYVPIGTVTRNNSTALAKMLVNSTTYTEASTGSAASGSVDKEEYVIVIQKNSTYAFAEYNTVNGRKRAYLLMANLAIQNTGAGVPALSGSSGLPASSSVSLSNLNPVTYTNGSTNEMTYQTVADANQSTNSIGYLDPYESAKCCGVINGRYLLTYASGTTRKAGLVNWPDSVNGAATTGALYKNGSTSEPVYRTTADAGNRVNSIGSLDAWEQAACFGTEDDFYLVAYLITGTTNMKIGFVVYNGGLSGSSSGGIPASSSVSLSSMNSVTYTNGSTNEMTYQTVADANQKTNSIGYLDPYESAKCFGIINGKYLLTYASGTTRKAGFVNWPDSVSSAATTGALYKNGSTSEPVYKTTADARNKVNSIGSLDAWEQAACFGTEDGFYLVAYLINGTTNIKTGFVAYNGGLYSAPVALPAIDQQSIPNAAKGSYGTSGQNNDLVYYKVGNGPNHMIVNFAIHGFEDKWSADGLALFHVARELLKSLSGSMYSLVNSKGWTVYVIPTSNPDGILKGTTNNGKGRCTTTWLDNGVLSTAHGIDMNRCFPEGFQPFYTDRNYTGPVSLGCREAVALRQFIDNQKSANGHNVFIDAHGWEQQIITGPYSSSRPGREFIQNAFKSEFSGNSQNQGLYNGSGYVARYADAKGYDGCLYEFPNYSDVNSPEDLVNKGYATRFVSAIRKIIEGHVSNTVTASNLKIYQTKETYRLDGNGLEPEDIKYNTKTQSQLTEMNGISWVDFLPGEDAASYRRYWENLCKTTSTQPLQNVVLDMVSWFMGGTGSDYSNATLTSHAEAHSSTQNYVNTVKKYLHDILKTYKGDINGLQYNVSTRDIHPLVRMLSDNNIYQPVFDTTADTVTGLKMCVDSLWGNEIIVKSYSSNGTSYSGVLTFTLYDHFGLDTDDIDKFGGFAGFRGWCILQHYKNYNGAYKPFVTKMSFDVAISGQL